MIELTAIFEFEKFRFENADGDTIIADAGISRAKQRCVLVGKKSTADLMCKKVSINKRKTFLAEAIRLKLSKLEMAGL